METYLKLSSVKNDKNCNCITPFYLSDIRGLNPNTQREYSNADVDAIKTSLYRISNAKGCNISVCCDVNDPTTTPDPKFTKEFINKYPKIMPLYEGSNINGFKLSTTLDVKSSGWQDPTPYMICKITKAQITDTEDPTVKLVSNLVKDCYSNNCSSLETITVNSILQNAQPDMKYTYFDDARVSQAILENNITYVKEYIRKYKQINIPLTNDDYNNRLIHLAAGSNSPEILTMLIALKADLNIKNKLNETPTHFAVRNKNIENISTLLAQGVDLSIMNNKGETPIFYAMKTGNLSIINMLYNNNSPIQGVDNNGNNLIHYCIINCPSYKEDDESIPNTKGEIIQFLIDHGISTEYKNNNGITPLELVSKEINKEINKECAQNTKQDNEQIIETFFGTSNQQNTPHTPHTSHIPNSQKILKEHFTNNNTRQNIADYTTEHISLLDIQSKLFNNILRNNPNKYSDYINVSEIPAGAPIEVLDTVCVNKASSTRGKTPSNMLTGNEDSEECLAKGGELVKIKNKTTKIKLELIPETESKLANIKQNELYYPKHNDKIPRGTVPGSVSSYNASINHLEDATQTMLKTTQTKGITYDLGQNSNNTIPSITHTRNQTAKTISTSADTITQNTQKQYTQTGSGSGSGSGSNKQTLTSTQLETKPITASKPFQEHPPELEDEDDIVYKCKKDAFANTSKFINTTAGTTTSNINNNNNNIIEFINKYKLYLLIIIIIIIIILCVIGCLIIK